MNFSINEWILLIFQIKLINLKKSYKTYWLYFAFLYFFKTGYSRHFRKCTVIDCKLFGKKYIAIMLRNHTAVPKIVFYRTHWIISSGTAGNTDKTVKLWGDCLFKGNHSIIPWFMSKTFHFLRPFTCSCGSVLHSPLAFHCSPICLVNLFSLSNLQFLQEKPFNFFCAFFCSSPSPSFTFTEKIKETRWWKHLYKT